MPAGTTTWRASSASNPIPRFVSCVRDYRILVSSGGLNLGDLPRQCGELAVQRGAGHALLIGHRDDDFAALREQDFEVVAVLDGPGEGLRPAPHLGGSV